MRNDHLGDLILTFPLLQTATSWLGSSNVKALINSDLATLFTNVFPDVEPLKDSGGNFLSLARVIKESDCDTLISATSKTRNAWAAQWSGTPQRLGFGYKLNAIFYTQPLFVHRKNPPVHESEFCLKYLDKFNDEIKRIPGLPDWSPPEQAMNEARS
ncbi:MAG: glycosyltransferase family 9 protein, partial [bacterium]